MIETGVGNCHVYVDASADPAMAEAIVLNSKTHRVSVCNSAETLLVHRDVPFLPRLLVGAGRRRRDAARRRRRRRPRTTPSSRRPTRTGRPSTCRWTWPCGWSTTCPPRWTTSRGGGAGTARRSWPTPPPPSPTSPPGWTPPPCWSTPRPGSPTAASSASAPRSASPPRSCTPAGPLGLPELTSTTYVVTGNGHTR